MTTTHPQTGKKIEGSSEWETGKLTRITNHNPLREKVGGFSVSLDSRQEN
jgi:hypothetical protein